MLRKKLWRTKLKENPQEYERYKIIESYRKLKKSNKTNNNTDPAADIVIENASEIVEERPGSSNGGSNSSPTTIHKIFETNSSFMWNSALRKKFNFYFQQFFASIAKIFILGGKLDTRLKFYKILRFSWYFLIS